MSNFNFEQHSSYTKSGNLKRKIHLRSLKRLLGNWRGVTITVPGTVVLIIALRLAGWLQPLEWAVLDTFFQLRPLEPPDERILIVGIEESDLQKLGEWPISDKVLATLLNKIKQQRPRAIGLDLYRDLPIEPGHSELLKVFRSTPNLIGVQKVIGESSSKNNILSSKVAPPPELERLGQLSASDVVVDGDGVVRRGILFPMPEGNEGIPGLGLAVAATYLKEQGITPTPTHNGFMKFGKSVFIPFKGNDGGYIRADAGGYQTLINFRGPAGSFPQVSLTAVLENRIAPDLMRDRIVLIGSVATSINDAFPTPYSKEPITNIRGVITTPLRSPGVEIHANIASQIISSALDNRPLFRVWAEPVEGLWLILWSAIPATLGWRLQAKNNSKHFPLKFLFSIVVSLPILASILIYGSYQAFLVSLWIPVVPPLLALFCSTIAIVVYTGFNKLEEYSSILESKVEERTQELVTRNKELKKAFEQIETAQTQIITRERLTFLGTLTAGIAYEIRLPLDSISSFARSISNLTVELQEEVDQNKLRCLSAKENDKLDKIMLKIASGVAEMESQLFLVDKLVQTIDIGAYHSDNEPKLSNISELLNSSALLAHNSVRNKYKNFNVSIETKYHSHNEQIRVFPEDIIRVFVNIIDNALCSTYKKVEIFEEKFKPKILLKTKKINSSVEIRVWDNGLGIPLEMLDKVFNPFFKGKHFGSGMGLGLYIAHNIIVEKHKGDISIETRPGVYTEIIVVLPKELGMGNRAENDVELASSEGKIFTMLDSEFDER